MGAGGEALSLAIDGYAPIAFFAFGKVTAKEDIVVVVAGPYERPYHVGPLPVKQSAGTNHRRSARKIPQRPLYALSTPSPKLL